MGTLQPSERMMLAAQRSQAVSERLSALARISRFSSSGGQRTRAGTRQRRVLVAIWVVACLLPTLAGAVYYGLILAPRFVTSLNLSVRGAEIMAIADKDGSFARLGALETVQNTLIVVEYMKGRSFVEDLEKVVPLRSVYSSPEADVFSRLDPTEPIEKLQEYLKTYITTSMGGQSLAVHITVRAFTAEESLQVARAVQTVCEQMINKLSERARDTALADAGRQLGAAESQLSRLSDQMRALRNQQGVIDVNAVAKQRLSILTGLQKERLSTDLQLRSLEGQLAPDAPSIRRLRERRDQLDKSIAEQTRAMASMGEDASVLSNKAMLFEALEIERKASEKSYIDLLKASQVARIQAERQQVFLNTIVAPELAQSSREPHRLYSIALVFGASVLAALALSAARKIVSA